MPSPPKVPARLQVDPDSITDDDKPPQTGTVFNIWYLKWSHGDSLLRETSEPAKFRVDIKKDQGYTKARGEKPVCLFFARGCCYEGSTCEYFHRLPLLQWQSSIVDCFGRDKISEARDDHNEVGVLGKPNRTLWVWGTNESEDKLKAVFSEFGQVEKVRKLATKKCSFVTFKYESLAQFAREAMQSQKVAGDVLTVRWAAEDPSGASKEDEKRRLEEAAEEFIKKVLEDEKTKGEEETEEKQVVMETPQVMEPRKKLRKLDFSHLIKGDKKDEKEEKKKEVLVEYSSDED